MSRSLKAYIAVAVALSVAALVAATEFSVPDDAIALRLWTSSGQTPLDLEIALGVAFWVVVATISSAMPVQLPRGIKLTVSMAPIVAATVLGGPIVAGWVAAIGTTELREIRGRVPWYGSLANHAGIVLPAVLAGVVRESLRGGAHGSLPLDFITALAAAAVFFFGNMWLVATMVALRSGQTVSAVFVGDLRGIAANTVALAPLAWLMSLVYAQAWWATLLFAVPLYTTRLAYQKFVEMREMFTQTIGALAEAVDKRDPYTSKHSHRVKAIAVDIGKEMRVSDSELEALEWGGLLHDVGKIGVRDAVLLKQDRLTREERMQMNAHPVLGAEIIAPVKKLAPELPIIRHHHEWFNGSGYPDRLIGDEIPKMARILHVADAFEAMTAKRPYRMTPLTTDQALAELRKFAGIQFDPVVVDAFVRTDWITDTTDGAVPPELRPIPLIAQTAGRMAKTPETVPAGADQA